MSRLLLTALLACGLVGCIADTPEATFLRGAAELRCQGVFPVCQGRVAGCVLDEDHYVQGTFPGQRSVIVETDPGDWLITVGIFFRKRIAPGSELLVNWFEPGCADEYRYDSIQAGVTDIFYKAGPDRVYDVSARVAQTGDHLIEVYSDATAEYLLKIELTQVNLENPDGSG